MNDNKTPAVDAPGALADRTCEPCRGEAPPLKGKRLRLLLSQLDGWQVAQEHHLHKECKFRNFAEALAFVNRVGEVAEREKHHPWIHFTWGTVLIEIWTHKIDGLTESDFVLAAKIDRLTPRP